MTKDTEIEDISNEDITNMDEVETVIYTPNLEDEDLECSDEVYDSLDYYDMDWPSQTVTTFKNKYVLVGTNPDNEPGKLKVFDLNKMGQEDFEVNSLTASVSYNRIRTNENINCVSDTTFDIYNEDLKLLESLSYDNVDYGLCSTSESSIFSHDKGNVSIFTDRVTETRFVHSDSINSLNFHNSLIYSASSDKSSKITDLRSKDVVFHKIEKAEINAIDTNKDNLFAMGDDLGSIKVIDMRMPKNEIGIFWHKSSISSLTWKDSDIFLSTSDEQLCIFDTSLEDEWEYEKYLLFVHQGQRYYKDVCLVNNLVITTSVDGLCFFTPISFSE
ncbi:WD40 repeat domain-containing protein [Vairimorpha necatrix]|uniref:WD40 repeat domain-containing protein n=1 Tax=Vairimorpha necatrix TaxID=6039 RepID=A0AAX4JC56_9MICR